MRTGFFANHETPFEIQIADRVFLFVPMRVSWDVHLHLYSDQRVRERKERVLIAFTTSMFQQTGHPQIVYTHTRKVIGDGWNLKCSSRRAEK